MDWYAFTDVEFVWHGSVKTTWVLVKQQCKDCMDYQELLPTKSSKCGTKSSSLRTMQKLKQMFS